VRWFNFFEVTASTKYTSTQDIRCSILIETQVTGIPSFVNVNSEFRSKEHNTTQQNKTKYFSKVRQKSLQRNTGTKKVQNQEIWYDAVDKA
jgi:hypothetical protein